ncbi:MAG: hypothetical protein U0324_00140 [Polyangiales bacterium]
MTDGGVTSGTSRKRHPSAPCSPSERPNDGDTRRHALHTPTAGTSIATSRVPSHDASKGYGIKMDDVDDDSQYQNRVSMEIRNPGRLRRPRHGPIVSGMDGGPIARSSATLRQRVMVTLLACAALGCGASTTSAQGGDAADATVVLDASPDAALDASPDASDAPL